jgi:hypothetical protein
MDVKYRDASSNFVWCACDDLIVVTLTVLRFPLFGCSENQLEEVLTVYTRLSHSASVFLRTNSRPSSATVSAPPGTDSATARPRKMSERDKDEKTNVVEVSVKPVKPDRDDGRELEHSFLACLLWCFICRQTHNATFSR